MNPNTSKTNSNINIDFGIPSKQPQQKLDQLIIGDEWKNDLNTQDRELADEVETKLAEVQKQMKLIEDQKKKLENRMSFPFGLGRSSSPPASHQQQQHPQGDQSGQQSEPIMSEPQISEKDFPVIDHRGNLITGVDVAIENYNNSYPFLRCFQLPFCANQIKKKVQFWALAGVGLGASFEAFKIVSNWERKKNKNKTP